MKTEEKVHELFLNYACNAKCPFCYNPPLTPELLRLDLSWEQAAESLYAGAKSGAKFLNLHGGEVTLRDDLPKILALARKLHFEQITLVTNGLRLSHRDYLDDLIAAGATHFRLSVHGPDAATHDAILAIPGGFSKVLAAIENIQATGKPLGMNFVFIAENRMTFPAFLEFFCIGKGVRDVIAYFPHLRGMMDINAGSSLSYAEAVGPVRAGFAVLDERGLRDSLLLANFIPCVLPEFTDRMLDWATHHGTAMMTHPEGTQEDLHKMKASQRAFVKACASCAVGARCLGVEREYLGRRGEAEFLPLETDPEAVSA